MNRRWVLISAGMVGLSLVLQTISRTATVKKPLRIHPLQGDARMLAFQGIRLSDPQARNLERMLKKDPGDLTSRTQLLGYYFNKSFESPAAKKAHQQHALWIISNAPETPSAGVTEIELDPITDGEVYYRAKTLWVNHIQKKPKSAPLLSNAANFFLQHDRDLSEKYLKVTRCASCKGKEGK